MHFLRVLLDAEALLIGSTGVLAVAMPEAFVRTFGPSTSAAELLFVPVLGAALVGGAALQHGLIALRDTHPLRLMLQCRLVVDALVLLITLFRLPTFVGGSQAVLLGAVSVALVFVALRFYTLIVLSDATGGPRDPIDGEVG